MTAKTDLNQARAEMLAVLDAKLKDMPEWKAFRAIDRAITAMDEPAVAKATRKRRGKKKESYGDIALEALNSAGMPMTTADMVNTIASRKGLRADDRKVKINIQSALSHDARFKNIAWRGGRAWWFADRAAPADESAGSSLRL